MSGVGRSSQNRSDRSSLPFFRGLRRSGARILGRGMILALVTGCTTVGPDFKSPTLAKGVSVLPASSPQVGGAEGDAQHFVAGQTGSQDWWKSYGCPDLDGLVQIALDQNPTVEAARATLIQAGENATAIQDNLTLPTVDAQFAQTRQRFSTAAFGMPGGQIYQFNLSNASVNVSYPLDVFGGNRRQVEALQAQHEMQAHLWQAARETLIANVVTTVVREASLRAQLDATNALLQAQGELLDLTRQRQGMGALSLNEMAEPQAELAQSRANREVLALQLEQIRHQLAAYLGQYPAQNSLPEFHLADLHLPQFLPQAVPSALLRQRPDIRASEAQWHQATANLGVTIAGAYPNLTLTGDMGAMALTPGALFSPASSVWSLGAGVVQPIFHGGALSAAKRGAEAAVQSAAAQYRNTVVQAFRTVADVLRALTHDAATLEAERSIMEIRQQSLDLADQQYRLGGISYPALLAARVQDAQALMGVAQAQGVRLADTAAFYLALGGEVDPAAVAQATPVSPSSSAQSALPDAR
ncbi:efflux transporter outer membrane subunit [Ferrovum myxofaciens]|uniref:efflux transporter outer membrane subunit n=1 Tax=Ferrovum myxofaciens TaxID=416213 RepID=UPI003EBEE4C3